MGMDQSSVLADVLQRRWFTKRYRLIGIGLGGAALLLSGGILLKDLEALRRARATSTAQPEVISHLVSDLSLTASRATDYLPISEVEPLFLPPEKAAEAIARKATEGLSLCPASPPLAAQQRIAAWSDRLNLSSQSQISQWNSTLAAYVKPAAWPEIQVRSRLAKVPIVMYHDVLPEKEVFFDITFERLAADFRAIKAQGLTPISLDQLVAHLRTGVPLPPKPVLLTFDDGYAGHYNYVFKLLKRYRYPAAFSVFTGKLDGEVIGRSTLTWEQLQEMANHPLVTVVSHSVTHPSDLRAVSDADLRYEVEASKQRLEAKLGMPIRYFTYPEGNHDERVVAAVKAAGYEAALIMDNVAGQFAGQSEDLLTLERFGESRFAEVTKAAWGGPLLPGLAPAFDFNSPIQRTELEIDDMPVTLIAGGHPQTIHADSRYSVTEIVANTEAIAAVDGAFFSLEYLDSNTMIGPVLGQNTGEFVPGDRGDIDKLKGRPLVLIGPQAAQFISFDPAQHNTRAGIQQAMPAVTDAFVGAAWLVHEQQAQTAETFKNLYAFDALRHRAFWGINQQGQPVVGVTHERIDSVSLGRLLAQVGFQEAVMLDSGASTSLVYEGASLMGFESRPVPHVVALVPNACM